MAIRWPWSPRESEAKQSVWERFLQILDSSYTSKSGASVNYATALEVSTVLACVRVISEGIAQVPLKLLRESPDGRTRNPAKDHPLYKVLHLRPNRWQTSFEFRETIGLHVALCGNAYCYKGAYKGQIGELIPFEPQTVTVRRAADGEPSYRVVSNAGSRDFSAAEIWHLRGPSWNGYLGLEIVKLAREAIGLAMSIEEQQGALYQRGIRPPGVYSVEGVIDNKQKENLDAWLATYASGGKRYGSPLILDRSAKWMQQALSNVDAQTDESTSRQIEKICSEFRVMPIMIGHSDKASTYASAEQMFLAHVVHCLAPWYERIEQSIATGLLTEKEVDGGLYACFIEEGLLRGSIKDTKDVLLGYVNGGLMTPNEGRSKLDLPPDVDPKSDKLRIPQNLTGKPGGNNEPDPAAA